jgi:hypothetical protein
MKKLLLFISAAFTLGLAGCFETTEEITLNEDGTGTYVNISDMSNVIPMAKNMGGAQQIPNIDSSFALGQSKESTEGMSEADVALLTTGKMHMKINLDDEKFVSTATFPISSVNDIPKINKLLAQSSIKAVMSQMNAGGQMPAGIDQMGEPSSFADYYTLEYENGEIKRKLNKDKHATLSSDKYLTGLQEAAAMGIPITHTLVINLPRPAEKIEGKNAKLSDDKKKVTVSGTIDDLFESPEKLEFKVKY